MGKQILHEKNAAFIHRTAEVSAQARIGSQVKIWDHVHIREGAVIGDETIVGKGVYIDCGVVVGKRCKIQNGSYLYKGLELEDGVFVGPGVSFANDRIPRAVTPEGRLKQSTDWSCGTILVRYGASLGAGVVVVPSVVIGRFAMVGAGAVITRDVPDHGLVVGVRARLIGYVCRCGRRLESSNGNLECPQCVRSRRHGRLLKGL